MVHDMTLIGRGKYAGHVLNGGREGVTFTTGVAVA